MSVQVSNKIKLSKTKNKIGKIFLKGKGISSIDLNDNEIQVFTKSFIRRKEVGVLSCDGYNNWENVKDWKLTINDKDYLDVLDTAGREIRDEFEIQLTIVINFMFDGELKIKVKFKNEVKEIPYEVYDEVGLADYSQMTYDDFRDKYLMEKL